MPDYLVEVRVTTSRTVCVLANTLEEALQAAGDAELAVPRSDIAAVATSPALSESLPSEC